jgi:hypothetical protein
MTTYGRFTLHLMKVINKFFSRNAGSEKFKFTWKLFDIVQGLILVNAKKKKNWVGKVWFCMAGSWYVLEVRCITVGDQLNFYIGYYSDIFSFLKQLARKVELWACLFKWPPVVGWSCKFKCKHTRWLGWAVWPMYQACTCCYLVIIMWHRMQY